MLAVVLVAVPNVSEGRNPSAIDAIGAGFAPARVLDAHSDPDHNRSVFTLAAEQGELAQALASGARAAAERIDLRTYTGLHPHVGALDVAPVVYLSDEQRGAPVAEAELVGLAPAAALADFPDDLPLRNRRTIEDALGAAQSD